MSKTWATFGLGLRRELRLTGACRFKSHTLHNRQPRVAGKPGVPGGPRAPQVSGPAPGLVELRVLAGSAEPRLRAELQPRGIERLARHEKKGMPSGGRPFQASASAKPSGAMLPVRLTTHTCPRTRKPNASAGPVASLIVTAVAAAGHSGRGDPARSFCVCRRGTRSSRRSKNVMCGLEDYRHPLHSIASKDPF
jgi:hypothetical protein